MPDFQMSVRAYSDTIESMEMGRTTLAAMLPEVLVPIVLSYGVSSPIPASASTDLSAVMPNTESVGLEGAGHYLWMERPGIVRETLDRLVAAVSG
jgi:pimeloyl-ACP methyl ester carboxylesterase